MCKDRNKLSWRDLKVGDKFRLIVDEFDGHSENICRVTEVFEDHLIAYDEVVNWPKMWIDDDVIITEV